MKTQIIKIGNSKGIRIPKAVLEQCGLKDKATLNVVDGKIVLHADKPARKGWEERFKNMVKDDAEKEFKELESVKNKWDDEEWEW